MGTSFVFGACIFRSFFNNLVPEQKASCKKLWEVVTFTSELCYTHYYFNKGVVVTFTVDDKNEKKITGEILQINSTVVVHARIITSVGIDRRHRPSSSSFSFAFLIPLVDSRKLRKFCRNIHAQVSLLSSCYLKHDLLKIPSMTFRKIPLQSFYNVINKYVCALLF